MTIGQRLQLLRAKQAVLQGSIRPFRSVAGEEAIRDFVDSASHQEREDELVRLARIPRNELIQVERAIRELSDRDREGKPVWNGNCKDCHEPIPDERLRAVPEATRCLECSNKNPEPLEVFPDSKENRMPKPGRGFKPSAKQSFHYLWR